jgi:hypothetical protein
MKLLDIHVCVWNKILNNNNNNLVSFLQTCSSRNRFLFSLYVCPLGSLSHIEYTNRNLICLHAHANDDDGVSIVRLIEKLMKQIFSSNYYYYYHHLLFPIINERDRWDINTNFNHHSIVFKECSIWQCKKTQHLWCC